MKILKEDMIGQSNINKFGEKFTIYDYKDCEHIYIVFNESNYKTKTTHDAFKNERCFSSYARTIFERGYLGEGEYKPTKFVPSKNRNNNTKEYVAWGGIFTRCYNENYHKEKPTYIGCEICEEWCNFQNFAKWYNENYWECGNSSMVVDKDILYKGNKIYSPKNCVIIPQGLNSLLTNCKTVRGSLPIGVSYCKQGQKHYRARVSNHILEDNKRIDLGTFATPEEAFQAYKITKEKVIKEVADYYKNKYPKFPKKLYDALYAYEVEITD